MNQPQTPNNEVVNLSPPQEWLYKCDCPQCRVGAHFNKDIAESYRKRGKLNNEVARLREENAELKQGKVFVDPKWIYDLETNLAKAHEELCQAGLREYGN